MVSLSAAMDISADLMELGKTPVAVVCAGAKSILDIPKTLEILVSVSFFDNYYSCYSFFLVSINRMHNV
jgi:pseudouridine-5'-phosphate glycosidase